MKETDLEDSDEVSDPFWSSSEEEQVGVADSEVTDDLPKLKRARLRLWCAFTTQSMAIGYQSSEMARPKVSQYHPSFQPNRY